MGQQLYSRRDVGISYASDFDTGQRLPLNCLVNRVLDRSILVTLLGRGLYRDLNSRIRKQPRSLLAHSSQSLADGT